MTKLFEAEFKGEEEGNEVGVVVVVVWPEATLAIIEVIFDEQVVDVDVVV